MAIIGCGASALNSIAYWVPSPWGDELATRSAAERPLGDLVQMVVTHVDAVHAVYYLVLHAVVAIGGTSAAVLRAPSVLAVGVAASGVAVLGDRMDGRRLGVIAAVVFALVPEVSWAATEARSSAFVLAVSAWSTVALVVGLQRGGRRWVFYCLISAVAVLLNVYCVLLILAQLCAVALVPTWRRRGFRPAAVSGAVAIAVASPIIVLSLLQAGQVGWLTPFDAGTGREIVEHQWFGDAALFAVLAWGAMVAAGAMLATRRLSTRQRRAVVLAGCCVLLPTSVLVAVTLLIRPVYAPRYAVLSLPAVALLTALPLLRVRRTAAIAAVLGVAALVVAPSFVSQRTAAAKGVDWNDLVSTLRASVEPGEPIWINAPDLQSFRILAGQILSEHPDIGLAESHLTSARLFDSVEPDRVVAVRATQYQQVLVVAVPSNWRSSAWLRELHEVGFTVVRTRLVDGAPSSVDDAVIVDLARHVR